jgi:hypothetical protein
LEKVRSHVALAYGQTVHQRARRLRALAGACGRSGATPLHDGRRAAARELARAGTLHCIAAARPHLSST